VSRLENMLTKSADFSRYNNPNTYSTYLRDMILVLLPASFLSHVPAAHYPRCKYVS